MGFLSVTAGAVGAAGSLLAGLPFMAGFTTAGVAAGSAAAAFQAVIGNVVAGSVFSVLQYVGATTVLGTVAGPVIAVVGTVACGAAVIIV